MQPKPTMTTISSNIIEQAVLDNMDFEPTRTQRLAIHALAMMTISEKPSPTLIINGYAGTGKTTLMRSFCEALSLFKIPMVLLAPTGRAAKVLANYTGRASSTIHKAIYRQATADSSSPFGLSFNKVRGGVFVVDEASMIGDETVIANGASPIWGGGRLLSDLVEYVFSQPGNRLVFIGDPDQLPPVGLDKSPALDIGYLKGFGLTVGQVWLSEVIRQAQDSLILWNSMGLRAIVEAAEGLEGRPKILGREGADVEHVTGAGLLEKIEDSYSRYGMRETVIITRSNRRATLYNIAIRAQSLYIEEKLAKGDILIVTKNNYLWAEKAGIDFIANGDIAEVVSIYGYSEMCGLHYADVSIRLVDRDEVDIDCKILLDYLTADVAVVDEVSQLKVEVSSEQIMKRLERITEEDYGDYSNKSKRATDIRKDPWINALQVRFAYAMTCHKAQGGQWDSVFVDVGYVDENVTTRQLAQWLYTAVTRARKKLYMVNYEEGQRER